MSAEEMTLAQHDAAVAEAQDNFANALAVAILTADADTIKGKLTALIAAAEARGAARATTDAATLALARMGAAYARGTIRDGAFRAAVEAALAAPNIHARITELLEGEA